MEKQGSVTGSELQRTIPFKITLLLYPYRNAQQFKLLPLASPYNSDQHPRYQIFNLFFHRLRHLKKLFPRFQWPPAITY